MKKYSTLACGYLHQAFLCRGRFSRRTPCGIVSYYYTSGYKGEYKGTSIISKKSAVTMQTPVSHDYGLAIEATKKLIPGVTMKDCGK